MIKNKEIKSPIPTRKKGTKTLREKRISWGISAVFVVLALYFFSKRYWSLMALSLIALVGHNLYPEILTGQVENIFFWALVGLRPIYYVGGSLIHLWTKMNIFK